MVEVVKPIIAHSSSTYLQLDSYAYLPLLLLLHSYKNTCQLFYDRGRLACGGLALVGSLIIIMRMMKMLMVA